MPAIINCNNNFDVLILRTRPAHFSLDLVELAILTENSARLNSYALDEFKICQLTEALDFCLDEREGNFFIHDDLQCFR